MEDTLFATLGPILIFIGLLGAVLPVIPGSPLAWVGFLLFKFSSYADYAWWVVWLALFFVLVGIALDYIVPGWGAKKMGGSKWGVWGTFLGLFVGIIFAPFGLVSIVVCPFLGAIVGELLYNRKDKKRALKAATGSFLGFLFTTGYGVLLCSVMLVITLFSLDSVLVDIFENVKGLLNL